MVSIDRYRILDSDVGLRYPSEAVADTFRHILSGFTFPDSSLPDSLYEIHAGPDSYRVTKDGSSQDEYRLLSDLASGLEWTLINAAFKAMPYLGIHAGVVTCDGRTVLLPGRSGAGKTTLVLGLLLKGWTLLSDEIAPVHPDTAAVHPFPRVLCVKNRSLDLFRCLDRSDLLRRPGAVMDVGEVDCVASGQFATLPPDRSLAVDTIVFPTHVEGAATSISEIASARALSLLMAQAFNRKAFQHRSFDILGRLVESARSFELRSGALEAALELLLNICNRTTPCRPQPQP